MMAELKGLIELASSANTNSANNDYPVLAMPPQASQSPKPSQACVATAPVGMPTMPPPPGAVAAGRSNTPSSQQAVVFVPDQRLAEHMTASPPSSSGNVPLPPCVPPVGMSPVGGADQAPPLFAFGANNSPPPVDVATTPNPPEPTTPPAVAPPPKVAVANPVAAPPVGAGVAGEHKITDEDQFDLAEVERKILNAIDRARFELGIKVLDGPDASNGEVGNEVHKAIWNMRFNAAKIINLPVEQLLSFEAALSAHQVFVQSEANRWAVMYEFLGAYIAQIKESRRDTVKGDRVKTVEMQILNSPAVRPVYERFLMAKAMAKLHEGLGDRFAQMEDGLKRAIDYVRMAAVHHQKQSGWVN